MSDWQVSTLGEVADFILGKMLDQAKNKGELRPYLANVNVRWGAFDLDGLRDMRFEPREVARYSLRYGDILMCEGGEPGRCAIWKSRESGPMFQKALHRIRPHDCLDSSFLYYSFLNFRKSDGFAGYFTGATIKHLPREQLAKVEVRFPEISAQQKIAAILSAYDDLIANNQRRITLLERMAEDIYREWFVRLRFPGHENTTIEKGVPQGWSVHKFRDVVQFYIGGGWGEEVQTATHSEPAYVVRGTDIPGLNNGDAQISSLRFHTPSNLKSRLMQKGDLVFEVSGGSKDQLLGRNLLVSERLLRAHDNRVICASFCKMLRFNTALVSPHAMKYFFKLYYETDLVGLYQVQSTGISNYQFEAFLNYQTVLLPPLDLQARFDAMVEPMLELKDDIALQTVVLRKTRDALLPRLISGKLSVDALDIRFPPGMTANLDKKPVHQEQRV